MAALNPHLNAGKPWMPEDVEALRNLAGADTPMRSVARQLGRSRDAVSKHAAKHGIAVGKNQAALKIERAEVRRNAGGDPPPPS